MLRNARSAVRNKIHFEKLHIGFMDISLLFRYSEETEAKESVKMANTILVVEDDKNIAQVVSEYLKDSGYIVRTAYTGGQAAAMLQERADIDLFLLDIMLPERTGLELLGDIRGDERYQETPVMMLTALSDEYTQLMSFDGLADDYVTKPFSPRLLVRRVQALLRRAGGGGIPARLGGLEVNHETFEVFLEGERINLTLREFELLGTLLTNARKVLNRQQLLNHVWGYDYFGDERIVDVHIKNLRKKLGAELIVTVKGVGYKLEPPAQEAGKRFGKRD